MIRALKKIFLIAFFSAGVWIYVMKEMGTVPMGTLFLYLGLWLAAGGVGFMLMRVPSPARKAAVGTNPYLRMTPSERDRARAIIQGNFQGQVVSAEDTGWVELLFERYAPDLTRSQQMEAFVAYLRLHAIEDDAGVGPPVALHDGPAVVLARAARRPGFDVTRDGTSWFGGLPALGDEAWPLDKGGKPMTPLVQIGLTGLASHLMVRGLPETGSLAFFAALPEKGEWLGRVVQIPQPGPPSQPPGPLPPVLNHSFGGPLRRGEAGDDQRLYPRMAMELVPISASGQTDRKAFDAEVEAALGPGREYNLDAGLFKEAMPDPTRPWNRDSLRRFLHGARIALGSGDRAEKELQKTRAGYESSIKGLTEKLAGETTEREVLQARLDNTRVALKRLDGIFADFGAATRQLTEELKAMEAWAQKGDRWQALTEPEQDVLAPLLEPWTARGGLGRAHLDQTYGIHRGMVQCIDETLLVLAVAADPLFDTLPEPVREAINGPWRQPYERRRHQMFGAPSSIQTAAEDNASARLLLQLQCDDIAGFHWGDAGVLQFWIRPEDLEAGRWDQAYMTFEGH